MPPPPPGRRSELVGPREAVRRQAAGLGAFADPWLEIGLGAGLVAEAPGEALGQGEDLGVGQTRRPCASAGSRRGRASSPAPASSGKISSLRFSPITATRRRPPARHAGHAPRRPPARSAPACRSWSAPAPRPPARRSRGRRGRRPGACGRACGPTASTIVVLVGEVDHQPHRLADAAAAGQLVAADACRSGRWWRRAAACRWSAACSAKRPRSPSLNLQLGGVGSTMALDGADPALLRADDGDRLALDRAPRVGTISADGRVGELGAALAERGLGAEALLAARSISPAIGCHCLLLGLAAAPSSSFCSSVERPCARAGSPSPPACASARRRMLRMASAWSVGELEASLISSAFGSSSSRMMRITSSRLR